MLLAATLAALAWANSPWWHSYEAVWRTPLSIRVGRLVISQDLRHWLNNGLMTFYFLVVGLEAKRELDIGELGSDGEGRSRWWRRSAAWSSRSRSTWR